MSETGYDEAALELAGVTWLELAGWRSAKGVAVAPPESPDDPWAADAERTRWSEPLLTRRLRAAVERLNPDLDALSWDEALRELARVRSPDLAEDNSQMCRLMRDGVKVERARPDGTIQTDIVRLVDFERVERNDWLVVQQFTVRPSGRSARRLDLVLFLNGMPVGVVELKNPTSTQVTVRDAFEQLQTYKSELHDLFAFNVLMVVSDGTAARIGSLTADFERFMPWRRFGDEDRARPPLEELLRDACAPRRVLDFIRYYTVFESGDERKVKKLAGYHQVHAVEVAVERTLACTRVEGDRRVGVVWHTQGSGKSLTMAFYAGRIATHPSMNNPTLVFLADREDLADQLHQSLESWRALLGNQGPERLTTREALRDALSSRTGGGVLCATLQLFVPSKKRGEVAMPMLCDRRNVVVIADEAHRSHYGFVEGYARHLHDALPNASFAGFTGTPIRRSDRDTRTVFGDYISVYDIQRSVEDRATVPIYYEFRAPRLDLEDAQRPRIDPDFAAATEGSAEADQQRLALRHSRFEALMCSEPVVRSISRDVVEHFERRLDVIDGKAMLTCVSRRACVAMHDAIRALRPQWFDDDDARGQVKVVMTGDGSDSVAWQPHIRDAARRRALANRFRREDDPFRLAIVCDMWLTGFDVPSAHTLYVGQSLREHGLLQAIARVNRVWRDKPGGLVVDYVAIAEELRDALANYVESEGRGTPTLALDEAVRAMRSLHEVCAAMLHGFDRSRWDARDPASRLSMLRAAQEHVLRQSDGKARFTLNVSNLTKAFALAATSAEAAEIRDEVSFFQAIRGALMKTEPASGGAAETSEHAVRQIVSRAVFSDEVVDVLAMAGVRSDGVAILSEEFLKEIRGLPQKQLAVEMLRRLLSEEVNRRARSSVVQSRTFRERLERTLNAYRSRTIETVEVIEALIEIAREMQAATSLGKKLGLSPAETAFYEALVDNDSARTMDNEVLLVMGRELTSIVRREASRIDWTERESVRARMRALVRRYLRTHGYPPDRRESATQTVLEQAELLGDSLVGSGGIVD
ncbi:MAG: type I restriction endonuclease subunit R [Polyangiales bacterium]